MEQRHRRRVRTPDRQLDLLDPSPPAAAGGATPGWHTLPPDTRRRLTGLMTRLLVEHAGGERPDRRSSADER
jgi:hypothetical protein